MWSTYLSDFIANPMFNVISTKQHIWLSGLLTTNVRTDGSMCVFVVITLC